MFQFLPQGPVRDRNTSVNGEMQTASIRRRLLQPPPQNLTTIESDAMLIRSEWSNAASICHRGQASPTPIV